MKSKENYCIELQYTKNNTSLSLPRLISDGMVIQRNSAVKLWGWASKGEKINISFINEEYHTYTDCDGKWVVILPQLEAGGPYSMVIKGNSTITLNNILIGDLWVCSGQSNMQTPMSRVDELYADEIDNCNYPAIRLFTVPEKYDFNSPQEDLPGGSWVEATRDNILQFSAVAYFYGKSLFEKYNVPIGLINSSVGGSPIEAWVSQDVLQEFPKQLETVTKFKDQSYIDKIKKEDEEDSNAWYEDLNRRDAGLSIDTPHWYNFNLDVSSWDLIDLPSSFEEQGLHNFTGVIWLRKEVYVPASMINKPAKLYLGTIVDSDTAYINGTFVGNTTYQYPPRRYNIPENLLKEGKNIITVRVISNNGMGEFVKDKPYKLTAGEHTLDLKGKWRYKVGAFSDPLPQATFIQWKPLGLFNGMISPLLNYTIKGALWYQGESNTASPRDYYTLLPALIHDWRKKWAIGDFPFLYVQLPNFGPSDDQPGESPWAVLREAQLQTLAVPNTSMAVTIDLGEWNDIHPLNKKDVGLRLSLAAQYKAYRDTNVTYSGPLYKSYKLDGSKIIISFTNIGGGLISVDGGKLKHFAIAGDDKKYIWAEAEIVEDKVVVWNDEIPNPVSLRYAWADNPASANLYNREGLPASPFRIDFIK
jgi:sialate O-acetylesterase